MTEAPRPFGAYLLVERLRGARATWRAVRREAEGGEAGGESAGVQVALKRIGPAPTDRRRWARGAAQGSGAANGAGHGAGGGPGSGIDRRSAAVEEAGGGSGGDETQGERAARSVDDRPARRWNDGPMPRLHHVNLAAPLARGEVGGERFVVSELAVGRSLESLLRAGPLPVTAAAWVVAEVARGLAFLHRTSDGEAQLVHRRVGPRTVVIGLAGEVRLCGLEESIAPPPRDGAGVFTDEERALRAPEQHAGEPVDPRTDVHALGALLRRAAGGEVVTAAGASAADPAGSWRMKLPTELERLIMRCLASSRAARPHSAGEVEGALRQWLAAQPVPFGREELAAIARERPGVPDEQEHGHAQENEQEQEREYERAIVEAGAGLTVERVDDGEPDENTVTARRDRPSWLAELRREIVGGEPESEGHTEFASDEAATSGGADPRSPADARDAPLDESATGERDPAISTKRATPSSPSLPAVPVNTSAREPSGATRLRRATTAGRTTGPATRALLVVGMLGAIVVVAVLAGLGGGSGGGSRNADGNGSRGASGAAVAVTGPTTRAPLPVTATFANTAPNGVAASARPGSTAVGATSAEREATARALIGAWQSAHPVGPGAAAEEPPLVIRALSRFLAATPRGASVELDGLRITVANARRDGTSLHVTLRLTNPGRIAISLPLHALRLPDAAQAAITFRPNAESLAADSVLDVAMTASALPSDLLHAGAVLVLPGAALAAYSELLP